MFALAQTISPTENAHGSFDGDIGAGGDIDESAYGLGNESFISCCEVFATKNVSKFEF